MALIDEFQDTDPLQYQIFRSLYFDQADCGLFLIGDPKQAIYAFRGADIFTYMRARRDAARSGAQYTLGTNWRSSSALVRAVNALFGNPEIAPFVYAEDIPFRPVRPGPEADREIFTLGREPAAPLEFWLLPEADGGKPLAKHSAAEMAARACAESIAELLNLGRGGAALLGERALQARDVAVLVSTHREGSLMQDALRERGVASVTLSQDSVFATREAHELAGVLAAVADPSDEGLVRGALGTELLGLGAAEIESLGRDEAAWEAMLARFQEYREL